MARDLNNDGSFSEDEMFSYAKDHLGSIHALVDNASRVVQRYEYSAYGKTKVEKTSSTVKLIKNPFCFTGRELDEETGDYYYRARYYSSWTGRFMSIDPIDLASGELNMYRYAFNNPLVYLDPFGLTASDVQSAITYSSETAGLPNATFSFGTPNGSTGMALPFANHILVHDKYSGDLSDGQKMNLLRTVHHELSHVEEGTLKSIFSSEEEHNSLGMNSHNFMLKHWRKLEKNKKSCGR